ncbi:MAG: response regulator transcription factor [Treponema sp.]|jgi:DNA-binding NarL/FixJ family response regulator|nr:response regulator transcription factor [Treponema sp.]
MICIVIFTEKDSDQYTKFIAAQSDIAIVAKGEDGYDALNRIPRLKPDIALLDEMLPLVDSAEFTMMLRCRSPNTRIIILATAQNHRVLKAIGYGASGYLLKNISQDQFIAGIKTVHHGGCLMTQEIAAKAFKMFPDANRDIPKITALPIRKEPPFPRHSNLSRRETHIIRCISKGFSNREIGEHLTLKEGTVRNYITAILEKTGLKNRTQIAIFAYNAGLLEEPEQRLSG